MTLYIDEMSPPEIRERRLVLSLGSEDTPIAQRSIVLNIDYSKALPEGVVLPLIFELQGPSRSSYFRRNFIRTIPQVVLVTPREGGLHMATLREFGHNRWWGSLQFEVLGEAAVSRS